MLIQKYQRTFGIYPQSILHVGANEGQEVETYANEGCSAVHIEAIPEIFEKLQTKCANHVSQTAIQGCCSDTKGEKVLFNIASNGGQSSSIFELGYSVEEYPSIVYTDSIELITTTLDDLLRENVPKQAFDFLIMDIQGAELCTLKGAHHLLSQPSLRALGVEVAHQELYQGGAVFNEISIYLERYGFFLKEVIFNNAGWADAIYLRKWWGKNSLLSQNMLHKYEELDNNGLKSVVLSSSRLNNITSDSLIQSLTSETMESAFKTKEELAPYAIIEFKEAIPSYGAIALFNGKGYMAQRLSSIKVDYSSNGIHWKDMQNISFRAEFLKAMGPLLCSSHEKFQFIRVSLTEKNFLHLTRLSILQKKNHAAVTDAFVETTSELQERYPFSTDKGNEPFYQYFDDSFYKSQCGQDFIVEKMLKNKKEGFFIEIGALDGLTISNTYLLEKKYNWHGLCIEPQKMQYEMLKKNRNCLCDDSCVDGKKGSVEFVTFKNGAINAAFSGIVGKGMDNQTNCDNFDRFEYEVTPMDSVLFEDVLKKHQVPGVIDYFSLDVEGAEYRILENFPFNQYKFLYINIERPEPRLIALLERHDYVYLGKFCFDGHFYHKDLLDLYEV